MAKRFTDSDKWKKPFIRNLPLEYKIFWLYILDDCDHAGIWHIDFEVAEIRLGIKLSSGEIKRYFGDKVIKNTGETSLTSSGRKAMVRKLNKKFAA